MEITDAYYIYQAMYNIVKVANIFNVLIILCKLIEQSFWSN